VNGDGHWGRVEVKQVRGTARRSRLRMCMHSYLTLRLRACLWCMAFFPSQFIKDSVGGIDFDDDDELEHAVNAVLGHSVLDDDGRDGLSDGDVNKADMRLLYSRQLGASVPPTVCVPRCSQCGDTIATSCGAVPTTDGLASVDDVVDWVIHGIQLPQYADAFHDNAISSYDLSSLLEDHGEPIETVLGVTNPLHRKKIVRAITVRLVGVASRTSPSVLLAWFSPVPSRRSDARFSSPCVTPPTLVGVCYVVLSPASTGHARTPAL
jgi:hypothetical protein